MGELGHELLMIEEKDHPFCEIDRMTVISPTGMPVTA